MNDVQVATKNEGALALADFESDAGAGFENQTQADMVIPFLKLMQVGSKEVKAKGSLAKAGMLMNSATGELFDGDKGVLIVPAITDHCYIEYRSRFSGGGFVAKHDVNAEIIAIAKAEALRLQRPFGKLYTDYTPNPQDQNKPMGNELAETFSLYAVVCDGTDPVGMAVLAFDSTDIKGYKKWNTGVASFMLQKADGSGKFSPALFSHSVLVTTVENNYHGDSAYNYVLKPANSTIKDSLITPNDPRYAAGRDLRALVNQGIAKAAVETGESRPEAGPGTRTNVF
jgi:hypothetical protein